MLHGIALSNNPVHIAGTGPDVGEAGFSPESGLFTDTTAISVSCQIQMCARVRRNRSVGIRALTGRPCELKYKRWVISGIICPAN
jgi:hypothetical protein